MVLVDAMGRLGLLRDPTGSDADRESDANGLRDPPAHAP